jgi:serine acetyltransferase
LHEVTLGGTGKERGDRHPKVRDGVLLCAGAKVLGNVEIGRDAKVGAGSVVLHDVPPRATVAGVPARIVLWCQESDKMENGQAGEAHSVLINDARGDWFAPVTGFSFVAGCRHVTPN